MKIHTKEFAHCGKPLKSDEEQQLRPPRTMLRYSRSKMLTFFNFLLDIILLNQFCQFYNIIAGILTLHFCVKIRMVCISNNRDSNRILIVNKNVQFCCLNFDIFEIGKAYNFVFIWKKSKTILVSFHLHFYNTMCNIKKMSFWLSVEKKRDKEEASNIWIFPHFILSAYCPAATQMIWTQKTFS